VNQVGPISDDHEIDLMIGQLLRAGVYVAAAVIASGGALFLYRHRSDPADYHTFHPSPHSLTSPLGIVASAAHGDSMSIMQLGMLILIAVPVARVVLSVFAFLARKDWLYVGISGLVLVVLLYSLILH